jgi:hypothetical protein
MSENKPGITLKSRDKHVSTLRIYTSAKTFALSRLTLSDIGQNMLSSWVW